MEDYDEDFDVDADGFFVNIREVTEKLASAYPDTNLGNKDDPFEELVYVVLSTRTREEYYQAAFQRLKEVVGNWNCLPEASIKELEEAISSAGLASKKAGSLVDAAEQIREDVGEVSLDFLYEMDTRAADLWLRKLPGVGVKTARCILMYSMKRPVFPLDTHCRRVSTRIGWFDAPDRAVPLRRIRMIESAIPAELRQPLHVCQIQHGRTVCSPQDPDCDSCAVSEFCEFFHSSEPATSR